MRNLHVFHLDVQSAGSLGDDGQSLCELQAVLSVLSQRLSFAIRLFGCLVSARETGVEGGSRRWGGARLPFIVASLASSLFQLSMHYTHFFFLEVGAVLFSECSGIERLEIMYMHLL